MGEVQKISALVIPEAAPESGEPAVVTAYAGAEIIGSGFRLPGEIPVGIGFLTILLFCTAELALGTNLDFAMLWGAALICFLIAFNLLGGMRTINGIALSILLVTDLFLPPVVQMLQGSAPDTKLLAPVMDACVYAVGMFSILCSVIFLRLISPRIRRQSAIVLRFDDSSYRKISLVALSIIWLPQAVSLLGITSGIFYGISVYLNDFVFVGEICAIIYILRKSKGTRAIDSVSFFYIAYLSAQGLVGFWKEAMIKPTALWLLTLVIFRFKFRRRHFLAVGGLALFFGLVILPLANLGHSFSGAQFGGQGQLDGALALGEAVAGAGGIAEFIKQNTQLEDSVKGYLGDGRSFFDRVAILPMADILINYVGTNRFVGWETARRAVAILPRSFSGDGLVILDNELGRLTGFLSSTDFATGISFGPFATAYSFDGWFSLIVLSFAFPLVAFFVNEFVVGKLEGNIFALSMLWPAVRLFFGASIDYPIFYAVRILPFTVIVWFFIDRTFGKTRVPR